MRQESLDLLSLSPSASSTAVSTSQLTHLNTPNSKAIIIMFTSNKNSKVCWTVLALALMSASGQALVVREADAALAVKGAVVERQGEYW